MTPILIVVFYIKRLNKTMELTIDTASQLLFKSHQILVIQPEFKVVSQPQTQTTDGIDSDKQNL